MEGSIALKNRGRIPLKKCVPEKSNPLTNGASRSRVRFYKLSSGVVSHFQRLRIMDSSVEIVQGHQEQDFRVRLSFCCGCI